MPIPRIDAGTMTIIRPWLIFLKGMAHIQILNTELRTIFIPPMAISGTGVIWTIIARSRKNSKKANPDFCPGPWKSAPGTNSEIILKRSFPRKDSLIWIKKAAGFPSHVTEICSGTLFS
jgi:hypothetical protein